MLLDTVVPLISMELNMVFYFCILTPIVAFKSFGQGQFSKDNVIWEYVSLIWILQCSEIEWVHPPSMIILICHCTFPFTINVPCLSISTLFSVSSVPFSLQSLSPPTSPQPEVQVSTPSIPPPDLVTEDKSPGHRTVEVAIPHVGTFVIESEEGGYDDEVALAQTNLLPVWHME